LNVIKTHGHLHPVWFCAVPLRGVAEGDHIKIPRSSQLDDGIPETLVSRGAEAL
jgi:hypothetical protein